MITFDFNTADFQMSEEELENFHDVAVIIGEGHDLDVREMLDRFKAFLIAMSYPAGAVEKIQYIGDENESK